jgi:nucleoside-diphosphate-sugar epimerase
MPRKALITGADGYLGGKIARAMLAGSDHHLLLAVNGTAGDDGFANKRRRLQAELGPLSRGRITIVPADLRRPDALADADPRGVRHVVHAAAVTRFNVEHDEALAANVAGTARVVEFAARCQDLQRLTILSSCTLPGVAAATSARNSSPRRPSRTTMNGQSGPPKNTCSGRLATCPARYSGCPPSSLMTTPD